MMVTIRPMEDADIPAVQALDRQAFALPWPPSAYAHELHHSPHSRLWVAEVEGQVVGFIVLWLILDEAHVATLAVHPDFRRRGIARRLLETLLTAAREAGARLATLEVRAGNLPAQALYRHYGFREVGRRPKYYTDNGEDALIMTVMLDSPAEFPAEGDQAHER